MYAFTFYLSMPFTFYLLKKVKHTEYYYIQYNISMAKQAGRITAGRR